MYVYTQVLTVSPPKGKDICEFANIGSYTIASMI